VAKANLGAKRICPQTGKKFYDLNKDPIVSPFTGMEYPLSCFEEGAVVPDAAPGKDIGPGTEDDTEENPARMRPRTMIPCWMKSQSKWEVKMTMTIHPRFALCLLKRTLRVSPRMRMCFSTVTAKTMMMILTLTAKAKNDLKEPYR